MLLNKNIKLFPVIELIKGECKYTYPQQDNTDFVSFKTEDTGMTAFFGINHRFKEILKFLEKRTSYHLIIMFETDTGGFKELVAKRFDLEQLVRQKRLIMKLGSMNEVDLSEIINRAGVRILEKNINFSFSKFFPEEERKKIIELMMSNLSSYATRKIAGTHLARNMILNLPFRAISYSFDEIKERYYADRVIVVGAGPSLDIYTDNSLSSIFNTGIVVACDSAVRPLIKRKLRFDLIATVDYQDHNCLKLVECMDLDIPLVFPPAASTRTVGCWLSPLTFLNDNNIIWNTLDSVKPLGSIVPIGLNVGYTATQVAAQLAQKEVILLGMDYCYTQEKAHAEHVYFQKMKNIPNIRIPNWEKKDTVQISYDLLGMKRLLEGFIKSVINERKINFLNLSKGAYIENCIHLQLDGIDLQRKIKKSHAVLRGRVDRERWHKIESELKQVKVEVRNLAQQINDILKTNSLNELRSFEDKIDKRSRAIKWCLETNFIHMKKSSIIPRYEQQEKELERLKFNFSSILFACQNIIYHIDLILHKRLRDDRKYANDLYASKESKKLDRLSKITLFSSHAMRLSQALDYYYSIEGSERNELAKYLSLYFEIEEGGMKWLDHLNIGKWCMKQN